MFIPLGEKMDAEGMVPLIRWETPDGGEETPYMYFFKHGMLAEKVVCIPKNYLNLI